MKDKAKATRLPGLLKNVATRFSQAKSEREEIYFQSNGILTLGVEIEIQLIDPDTLNLTPRAEELLSAAHHLKKVKPEFYLSTVEINTGICKDVKVVEKDLKETVEQLSKITQKLGISMATTGTHPFAKYSDSIISPTERYQELIDRNQWLTRRMTVYGLHVHLGMESGDDCIRYNNFFQYFMPHLIGLSASSPFWQGSDTGLSSCRPTTYEAMPTAGTPYQVQSWKEFENLYHSLKRCGSIKSFKDLWWDMRPSPGFGTLEIRVCDGCATLYETLAITAFIHTLSHWFADNGSWLESVTSPPHWLCRENKWRAIRHGLNADLVMNVDGRVKLLKDDVEEWIQKLQPYASKLGYEQYFTNLQAMIERGTSSDRQRKVFQQAESMKDVLALNIREFEMQVPQWYW